MHDLHTAHGTPMSQDGYVPFLNIVSHACLDLWGGGGGGGQLDVYIWHPTEGMWIIHAWLIGFEIFPYMYLDAACKCFCGPASYHNTDYRGVEYIYCNTFLTLNNSITER